MKGGLGRWTGGFGLDSVGSGEWWQGLESGSGLIKLGKSVWGGLWDRSKEVAMQWNKKGVWVKTQTACGSHRHRQQEKVAGDCGRRPEGAT